MPIDASKLEKPTDVADRFLLKYGSRSAWSSAMTIAEGFDDIGGETEFAYWKSVADSIKAKLQEGRKKS